MELLTIFTPAYNRAYILPQLYRSLLRQTDNRFEWVIVDDGSKDDTETLVQGWIQENRIKIGFQKQENQGKHIAVNAGAVLANGNLFFIVDSDDFLTDDAVEKILSFWETSRPQDDISGIITYKKLLDGQMVGSKLPPEIQRCKMWEAARKYGSTGDKAVVFRTEIFKQYAYPKFEDEKFLGESYVFNQIDEKYDMLIMDACLYLCDYRPDGLSQDFRRLYRNNPRGFLAIYEQSVEHSLNFKQRLKTMAHIFCLRLKLHCFWKGFKGKRFFLKCLATPFAFALYLKIFVLKKSDVKAVAETQAK
ncbi:MAG: glycosyltransferase family 2 protein [Clostridiales bacterium]|nr:glycosyltransferase family 2 protein [Clostridiales bacterium]MBE5747634.1 glycosyltransferase family 2 protein [Clostridiales bacterium]